MAADYFVVQTELKFNLFPQKYREKDYFYYGEYLNQSGRRKILIAFL